MNEKSIDIIKNTVKPDSELIERTLTAATAKKKIHLKPVLVAGIAACLVILICAAALPDGSVHIPSNACWVIDINNYSEVAGFADYVFIGRVEEEKGTKYERADIFDFPGMPYTNYTVTVLENIKGSLVLNKSVDIEKDGDATGKVIIAGSDDYFPKEGDICAFFASVQEDGTLMLQAHKTSNTKLSESVNELTEIKESELYKEIVSACENETPFERDRFTPLSVYTDGRELLYSNLVKFNYDEKSINTTSAVRVADIAAFSESMLKECSAVIEGKILSIREKEYTIVTEHDKFGEGGTLTEKINTLVYEVEINKVYCGDFTEKEIITVEDMLFICGTVNSMREGHSYVIPLCKGSEEIMNPDEVAIISGDIKRESVYSVLYPFHPQIERVNEGYVVVDEWDTLVSGEKEKITVDVDLSESDESYRDSMYLVSKEVFAEKLEEVLVSAGLK